MNAHDANTRVRHVEQVMGTTVSIDLVETRRATVPAAALVAGLVAWFHHVDDVFSPYRSGSVVTRLGRGELHADHPSLGGDVADVLARCHELRALTDGVFDVWNVPAPNGTRFDPCGYVKGWSVDVAVEMILAAGIDDFCVNAGGDVAVGASARPWRVGVRHPHDPTSLAMVLEVDGRGAVATSGSYERGAHIVDGRSGERCAAVASVTVVDRVLADADAFATTVYTLGTDGIDWLTGATEADACIITHDLELLMSPGFVRRLSSARHASAAQLRHVGQTPPRSSRFAV